MSPFSASIPGEPQWTEQQHLVYLLQNRDIPCPRCGANLRGLQNNRCPGCGSELALSLSPVKWHLGLWITAMAALCVSAGLGVFFLIVILNEGWPHGGSLPWIGLQLSLVYLICSIPCAVAIVVRRRRFQRMAARSQRGLAVLSVVLTGLALALLLAFFWFR